MSPIRIAASRRPLPILLAALVGLLAPPALVAPAGAVIAPGVPDATLIGLEGVELKPGAEVTSGDAVVQEAGGELRLDSEARVAGDGIADTIRLQPDSEIGGDAAFNTLQNRKGTIGGNEITPLSLPVFPTLPLFLTGDGGGADVTVAPGATQTLSPDDYGAISVGENATLILDGGEYSADSIACDDGCRIEASGAVSFAVLDDLEIGTGGFLGPEAGSGVDATEIVLYVGGEDDPKEAGRILDATEITASLYVPEGSLRLGPEATVRGGFIARQITLFPNTTVALETFFVNRPPVAGADSLTVDEGASTSTLDSGETSLLANDSDPNGDGLVVTTTPVTAPDHGTLTLNPDGTFTYTHDGSETTSDGFVYEVCDDGTAPGPLCSTAPVTITVIPVNDPPVADDTSVSTSENTPVEITLTASDAEGDTLTFSVATPPTDGSLGAITSTGPFSASVTYTPDSGFVGTDGFTFTVDDGNSGTDQGAVSIEVIEVNVSPVANPDAISVSSAGGTSSQLTSGATSVLSNDSDENGDPLTVTTTPVSGPDHGTLTLNADGTFVYTHDGSSTTEDAFVYEVCDDGSPVLCDTATVTVTIGQTTIQVTVSKTGQGTVSSSPAGIDCGTTCDATFTTDFAITLSALPASGWEFTGFGGDADCSDGKLEPNADKSCTATFEEQETPPATVTVSVLKDGSGTGFVASDPSGISCGAACTATFDAFERIHLEAIAAAGSRFEGWGGHGDCLDGVLDLLGDRTCAATFELLPAQATLTVTKTGSGDGTVVSSPFGIHCGTQCIADFDLGESVFLSARPDDGDTFEGWSGDCSGLAFGTTVALDTAKTCTAEFSSP